MKAPVSDGSHAGDRIEIRRALGVLIDPGQTFELRGLPFARSVVCRGSDLDAAVEAAWSLSDGAGVYWTLNPTRPDLEGAARVGDILARRWLLIDVDAVRPADTSASTAEVIEATDLAITIWEYLDSQDWPEPVAIDSGNGAHLLYRVDLPADKLAQQIIKGVLVHLAEKFDSEKAKVDRAVHNASRISKLPGTWARKGPNSPERPHRMARLVSVPSKIEIVPTERLQSLGTTKKEEIKAEANGRVKMLAPVTSGGSLAGYVRSAVERECVRIALATPGAAEGRNVTLNTSAFNLGTMAAWPEMVESSARGALRDAALRAGLEEGETARTIESGWSAGALKSRVRPASPGRNGTAPKTVSAGRIIILASDVIPRKVEWLWPDRIPIGKLTTFAGWGGLGKSFVTMDLAARISRGDEIPGLKGECFEAGNVLILNTEDDPDDTSVPRLMEAKADLTRIAFAKSEILGQFTLADLKTLDTMLAQLGGARLLVIDPATAHLGAANDHKNAELRALLMPLSLWAMERRLAVILVTHVNKPQAGKVEAMARVVGSVAWVNAVRAAVMFARDPEDKTRRLFIPFKSNNSPEQRGLAYRVVPTDDLARIEWLGEVETSADEAVNARGTSKTKSDWETAKDFLRTFLGQERPGDEVVEAGNKLLGESKHRNWWLKVLDQIPGGYSQRRGFGGRSFWGVSISNDAKNENVNGAYGGNGGNAEAHSHHSHHPHHTQEVGGNEVGMDDAVKAKALHQLVGLLMGGPIPRDKAVAIAAEMDIPFRVLVEAAKDLNVRSSVEDGQEMWSTS